MFAITLFSRKFANSRKFSACEFLAFQKSRKLSAHELSTTVNSRFDADPAPLACDNIYMDDSHCSRIAVLDMNA